MKKALIVQGGWDGHQPKECAELFAAKLTERGFAVEVSATLDAFNDAAKLAPLSLIVPISRKTSSTPFSPAWASPVFTAGCAMRFAATSTGSG